MDLGGFTSFIDATHQGEKIKVENATLEVKTLGAGGENSNGAGVLLVCGEDTIYIPINKNNFIKIVKQISAVVKKIDKLCDAVNSGLVPALAAGNVPVTGTITCPNAVSLKTELTQLNNDLDQLTKELD